MEKSKIIKDVILGVIIVGLIIALFNSYTRINELNNSVSNLQNNLDQNINTMRTDIADIYENVDQRLKKEASILSGYDITYGPLDTANYTTPILVSVTPKNADYNTSVSVKIGETTVIKGWVESAIKTFASMYPEKTSPLRFNCAIVSPILTETEVFLSAFLGVTDTNIGVV